MLSLKGSTLASPSVQGKGRPGSLLQVSGRRLLSQWAHGVSYTCLAVEHLFKGILGCRAERHDLRPTVCPWPLDTWPLLGINLHMRHHFPRGTALNPWEPLAQVTGCGTDAGSL